MGNTSCSRKHRGILPSYVLDKLWAYTSYHFHHLTCIGEGQVPWPANTATFRPALNAGSMALGSTTCRQRRGVGEGGGQDRNEEGKGREGQGRRGMDKEQRRESWAEERRPTEGERKN